VVALAVNKGEGVGSWDVLGVLLKGSPAGWWIDPSRVVLDAAA
jgi:hypothetical protein